LKDMRLAVGALLLLGGLGTVAAEAPAGAEYRLQPGDALTVSIWKEPELQAEVLIRPDGGMSFPLVGDVQASSLTVEALRSEIETRIRKWIPEATASVTVKAIAGNRIYVVGKVAHPGDFVLVRPTDVAQALALAGGTTTFADLSAIKVLRHDGARQVAVNFNYTEVEHGRRLEQNILLRSGDTVVVP
jgi:polysaccharide biosynthesis/export protein